MLVLRTMQRIVLFRRDLVAAAVPRVVESAVLRSVAEAECLTTEATARNRCYYWRRFGSARSMESPSEDNCAARLSVAAVSLEAAEA